MCQNVPSECQTVEANSEKLTPTHLCGVAVCDSFHHFSDLMIRSSLVNRLLEASTIVLKLVDLVQLAVHIPENKIFNNM